MTSRLFKTDLQTKLKQEMRDKLDRERMQRDFPFHPQTNEWQFRDREDVLSHLQQKETQRQQKLAMLQQQRELEITANTPSSPTISAYSRSLTFEEPFHLRLYTTPRGQSSHAMHGFDPEELEGERRRARKGNPDFEKLYADAQTRRTNLEQATLKAQWEQDMQCSSKKLKGKSLELMSQKSDKTIQKMTSLIWEGANGTGLVDKGVLVDVLRTIGIFRVYPNMDASNKLRATQEEKSLRKLCDFLLAVRQSSNSQNVSVSVSRIEESDESPFFRRSPTPSDLSPSPPPLPPDFDSPTPHSLPPPPPVSSSPPAPSSMLLPPPPLSPSPLLALDDSARTGTPLSIIHNPDADNQEINADDAVEFLSVIIRRCVPTEENRRINEESLQVPSPEENLIRKFISLYQTARAYDTLQQQRSPSPPREDYTFKPTINNKSQLMEGNRSAEGKDARYKKLFMMSSALAEKRAKMQEEGEKKKAKECTFTPQVNNSVEKPDGMKKSEALFNISKSKKKTENQLPGHIVRDLKHCSFQPNIQRRSLEFLQKPPTKAPRGVDHHEKRLRQAQQSREELQAMLERPSYPKPSALTAKPPSFLAERAKPAWEPPLLYVDIKLAHGRTGRVGIHRGDDPKVLAQNFANAFHLEAKLTSKLEDMLRLHIQNLENGTEEPDQHQPDEENEEGEEEEGEYESEGEYVQYRERGYHSDD